MISGRTSTSAVKFSESPSLNSVISTSGRPSVFTSCSRTAARMFSGMASWTASLSTAPRPTRWSMTAAGTLPRRKPGTLTCWAISRYAFLRLGSSSTNGTSMASRTRVGLRVSTVLFTGVLLDGSRFESGP